MPIWFWAVVIILAIALYHSFTTHEYALDVFPYVPEGKLPGKEHVTVTSENKQEAITYLEREAEAMLTNSNYNQVRYVIWRGILIVKSGFFEG